MLHEGEGFRRGQPNARSLYASRRPILPDTWTHVAIAIEESAISIYLNGVHDSRHDLPGAFAENPWPLGIGKFPLDFTPANSARVWLEHVRCMPRRTLTERMLEPAAAALPQQLAIKHKLIVGLQGSVNDMLDRCTQTDSPALRAKWVELLIPLTADEGRELMFASCDPKRIDICVAMLLRMADSHDSRIRELAIKALAFVTRVGKFRLSMIQHDGVRLLIGNTTPDTAFWAEVALSNLYALKEEDALLQSNEELYCFGSAPVPFADLEDEGRSYSVTSKDMPIGCTMMAMHLTTFVKIALGLCYRMGLLDYRTIASNPSAHSMASIPSQPNLIAGVKQPGTAPSPRVEITRDNSISDLNTPRERKERMSVTASSILDHKLLHWCISTYGFLTQPSTKIVKVFETRWVSLPPSWLPPCMATEACKAFRTPIASCREISVFIPAFCRAATHTGITRSSTENSSSPAPLRSGSSSTLGKPSPDPVEPAF
jgi:hypothetical protein